MNSQSLVLWFGHQANQKALAIKIQQQVLIKAIVIERPNVEKTRRKITIRKIIDKIRFRKIDQVWYNLLKNYEQTYPEWPNIHILEVENINNPKVAEWTKKQNPDLIAVSGTRLITKPVIQTPATYGIVNLHTGLSPYIKGGPNCTNWCIADDKMHLIGNTVMWIDEGIDSGKIITTSLTPLKGIKDFEMLHNKVMEHAHDLYIETIKSIFQRNGTVHSVDQKKIGKGRIYRNKEWNHSSKIRLLKRIPKIASLLEKAEKERHKGTIKTVP